MKAFLPYVRLVKAEVFLKYVSTPEEMCLHMVTCQSSHVRAPLLDKCLVFVVAAAVFAS